MQQDQHAADPDRTTNRPTPDVVFSRYGQLDTVLTDARARLVDAVRDRNAAMHAPVVATGDGDARIMVLRACDPDFATLRFHTDLRSPKTAVIAANPRVTVLAYDPVARVQLRMAGLARVISTGPIADEAWAAASPLSRRIYLVDQAPGTPLSSRLSTLPEGVRDHRPTFAQSEAGRPCFAVMMVRVETLDWLQLGRDGGVRARFTRTPDGFQGTWVAP